MAHPTPKARPRHVRSRLLLNDQAGTVDDLQRRPRARGGKPALLSASVLALVAACGGGAETSRDPFGADDGVAQAESGAIVVGGWQPMGPLGGSGGSPVVRPRRGTGGADLGCARVDVEPTPIWSPGNLLVVFDRSRTMSNAFGAVSRLEAAGAALVDALRPYACMGASSTSCTEHLEVAALLFPSDARLCGPILPLTDSAQIPWMSASEFISAWGSYWMTHDLLTGTPIQPAFSQAATELESARATMPGDFAVLFLTDGVGTCGEFVPPPQVSMWRDKGIMTHVVNVGGAIGLAYNDAVASVGGTGASLNPSDQVALHAVLATILHEVSGVASCDVLLRGQITDRGAACAEGDVRLGGRTLRCSESDGYLIRGEASIELVGEACGELLAGAPLQASFPCGAVVLE